MKKNVIVRLFSVLFAVICLSANLLYCAVAAKTPVVDLEKNGSVSVTLRSGEQALAGARLSLYKLARAYYADGTLDFEYIDEISPYIAFIDGFKTGNDRNGLIELIKNGKISPVSQCVTDISGRAVFTELQLGLYLCMQTGSVSGFSDCAPFLVSVPAYEDGSLIYDVDASPKTEVGKLVDINVKKVWNDGKAVHGERLTVRLYDGSTVVGTAVLSSENNWTYVWKQMPKSDCYSIEEVNIPSGYSASYRVDDDFYFTVTNSEMLIRTGQHKLPVPILAGCGVFFFIIGWGRFYAGKKQKNEKS